MKPMKLKTIIFLAILGERILLGAFAWDYHIAAWLYNIINFPFGVIDIRLDRYLWYTYGPSHWLTDEITSGFSFLITSTLQAVLYYYLIQRFLNKKEKRQPV